MAKPRERKPAKGSPPGRKRPVASPPKVQALKEQYELLCEAWGGCVVVLDSQGRIRRNDAGARLLFGRSSSELRGRPFASLLAGADRRLLKQILKIHGKNGEGQPRGPPMEGKGLRKDGSEFPVELLFRHVRFNGRSDPVAIVRDLTRWKAAEDKLRQAVDELRQVDKAKSEFINITAHELLTPLAPIKAELTLLRTAPAGALGKSERKSVGTLSRNVSRLEHFVESLLEVSRMQLGRFHLEKKAIDLSALATNTVGLFESAARHANVEMRVETTGRLKLVADETRIEQVVFNLISNALKFTPEGGRVIVRVGRLPGAGALEVEDTGVGFRPEDAAKLFQPFGQIEKDRQPRQKGSGLGLYICRRFVELHGGHVWAQSPGKGRGATFGFSLPR